MTYQTEESQRISAQVVTLYPMTVLYVPAGWWVQFFGQDEQSRFIKTMSGGVYPIVCVWSQFCLARFLNSSLLPLGRPTEIIAFKI